MTYVSRRFLLKGCVLLCGLSSLSPLYGGELEDMYDSYRYLLGDQIVVIKTHSNGEGPTFVCTHDNENTGVGAAMEIIAQYGGRVIELIHTGKRNISFTYKGVKYVFDPNRMFSSEGIESSLKTQGDKNYSKDAHNMITQFADVFMTHFNAPKSSLIVAIHNNTADAYSVLSYIGSGPYADEAQVVHMSEESDPDDFFFVTDENIFFSLSKRGFNVVLQSPQAADDGSLSVYAAAQGIPYVNVEAEIGHLRIQKQMLEALL